MKANTKSNLKVNKKRKRADFRDNVEMLFLTLPVVVYIFIMNYIPMAGLVIAFKDYRYNKGIFGSEWVGLKNFRYFFESQDLYRITRNTVLYSASFIVLGIVAGVVIALLLFEVKKKFAIKTYQTMMMLPNFLSWVIVSYIAYILLCPTYGVFNQIIAIFGGEGIDWYSNPAFWPPILIVFNIWKNVGMNAIMFYASLMAIDNSLFEAATIDGATKLQQSRYISMPSLVPLMTILLILNIGNIFRGDFGLFYQLPRDIGVLYPTTDIIDTYIYRGLRTGSLSATSAVGMVQSVVGLIMVLATNAIVKKISPENSMF